MEDKVESLRKMYEGFRRGKMEAESVRDEARLALQEAKKKGDSARDLWIGVNMQD